MFPMNRDIQALSYAGVALDRPRIMAIINVTPDSFSDGGERLEPAQAIDDGLRFVSEGADIVDVGGESTRPGSRPIDADEELQRVLPVVEGLARRGVVVPIDTRRAAVARACLDAAGIAHERIAVDPGLGFGKSVQENVDLVAGAGRLAEAGYPVLIGASRKSFIGRLTGIDEPRQRDPASIWLAVEAARRGAAFVRVHDVAGTRQALAVSRVMR
jgi:dihydropteroate synthase